MCNPNLSIHCRSLFCFAALFQQHQPNCFLPGDALLHTQLFCSARYFPQAALHKPPVGAVLIIASGITHLAAGSLSVPHFQKKGAKLTCAVVPLLLASAVLLGSLPMRSFCSNSRLNALSSSLSIWLHRAVYDETTNSMP